MRTLTRAWRLTGIVAIAAGVTLLHACSNEPSQSPSPLAPSPNLDITGYGSSAGYTFDVDGAQWTSGFDVNTSVGTGVIRPFLDMQASPSEEGFNTDNDDFQYDQHRTSDTNALPLNYLPVFAGPTGYGDVREIVLDAHESDNYFDVAEFEVYLCTTDAARTYSLRSDFEGASTCHPVYSIAGATPAPPIHATDQFSSGSGNVFDYRILIPNQMFQDSLGAGTPLCDYDPSPAGEAACHQYVVVWAKLDNTGSTFEEFSTILRPAVKIVKTPDDSTVDAGNDIKFSMVVSSAGETASAVTLADTLPMGPAGHEVNWYAYTTSAGTCAITGGPSPLQQYLNCSLGDIATNSPVTVTVTAHTQQTSCAVYDNTADVTSTDAGSDSDPGQITVQNCTGTVVIKKITNGGYGTAFDYTTTGGLTPASFSLTTTAAGAAGADSLVYLNVLAGPYSVTETAPPTGWQFTSLSCTTGGTVSSRTANITVVPNATVTCTYTNTKQGGITIEKVTNGGYGGPFPYTTTGSGLSSFNLTTTAEGTAGKDTKTFSNLAPGSYSVTEGTLPTGWEFTNLSCTTGGVASGKVADITLAAGQTVTCTYTNTKQGSIKIVKETVGGFGGPFPYTTTGSGLSSFNLTTTAAGGDSTTFSNLSPGSYSVTEGTLPTGWEFTSLSCSAGGLASAKVASITLAAGATVRCIYTNTKQGSIKIVKETTGGAATFPYTTTGGLSPATFNLTTTADGPAGRDSTTYSNLSPGSYSVTEGTLPTGWQFGSLSCSAGGVASAKVASITLAAGATVRCIYTNTKQGRIIIKKITNGGYGTAFDYSTTGGLTPASFSLTTTAAGAIGADSLVYTNVAPGPYSVTEGTLPGGWQFTSLSCTTGGVASGKVASITVAAGATVTCTYTNTKQGGITIEKVTNGGYGGPFPYTTTGSGLSSFNLTTTAEGTAGKDTKTFSDLAPGSYSVTEGTLPTGWQFTNLSCTTGGVASGKVADITLAAGATVTCTYTNTKQGKIIIKKVTNGGYGTAFDYSTTGGLSPATFSLTTTAAGAIGADSLVYLNVAPGPYSVTESPAPTGWQFTSLSCTTGGVASGKAADITLAAGATVTCTYTNTKQGTIKIVKETTGGAATFPYSTTGGLSPATFNLTTTADGPAGRDSTIYMNLSPGSYSVTEGTLPTGWAFSSLSCSAGGSVSAKVAGITLAAGATVRCIYTNQKQPKLTLVKRVVNDNGGTATVNDFGISTTAGSPLNFDSGVPDGTATTKYTSAILTVDPGTYQLHEGTLTGYDDGTWSCTKGLQSGNAQTGSVSLVAGDSIVCTITNNDQPPTLKVVKVVKGASSTFGYTATGDGLPGTFSLTPAVDNGADTVVYNNLTAGAFSVAEDAKSGYTLTDLGCSDQAIGQYDPAQTRTVIDTLALGETVTCTFINEQNSGTTRTQGFWATHMSLTQAVWFGGSAGGNDFSGLSAADQTLCSRQLTTIGEVLGGFWSNISHTTEHKKRSSLDQSRMQLLQQLLAAILNNAAFGSSPTGMSIADAKAAYCGTDISAIQAAQSAMASFNTSGDNGTFTPGVSANGKQAKDAADLPFWDVLP